MTAPEEAVGVTGPIVVNPNAKYGGILNLGDYVFPNLIFKPYEDAGALIKNQGGVYSGLIEFNPETDDIWDVRGDLADSWKLADDGVTYTFNINKDAIWHDGQAVTAEDVVFSIDRMMDPDATRPTNASLRPYLKPGNSRVIGRKTVEIKLNYRFGRVLARFRYRVRQDICQALGRVDDGLQRGRIRWAQGPSCLENSRRTSPLS